MSDVKDILGISPITQPKDKSKKSKAPEEKKPEWMSREVFALTMSPGGIPPPIVPVLSKSAFKQKRKIKTKAQHWEWKEFKNTARDDGVKFLHWGCGEEDSADYFCSKFNKKLKIFEYTELEYSTHFNEPGWTKEETDYLMELIKDYDMRWIIISDRYDSKKYPKRTIEDLKERFFRIQKVLGPMREGTNLYAKFTFNKGHEIERKKQAEVLLKRTKEQIKEIEDLLADYKKIESSQKRKLGEKKRASILKLTESAVLSPEPPKKKGAVAINRKKGKDVAGLPPPLTPKVRREHRVAGVYVRSAKMINPLNVPLRTARQVDATLDELGIPLRSMPTAEICRLYNDLRQDIVNMVELEALNKKKLYELELLKAQRDQLKQ